MTDYVKVLWAVIVVIFLAGGTYVVIDRNDIALAEVASTVTINGNRITRLEEQYRYTDKSLDDIKQELRGINQKLDRK